MSYWLFVGSNLRLIKIETNEKVMKKVISASRRIDMIGNSPQQLLELFIQKCPPEKVHSLVLWTKNVENLFSYKPLLEKVKQYDQLFFHYTVTGMGGSILEPGVVPPHKAMSSLEKIVKLVNDPRRVRFRFDPIVHLQMKDGSSYTNLSWFEKFAPRIKQTGITDVSISWMSVYRKVSARLKRTGIKIEDVSQDLWQQEYKKIMEIASVFDFTIHGCCVPGMNRSKCIDGLLLSKLHPTGEICSLRKAKGQRVECGCTESWDIGWYFKCIHGCRYCYANPVE